MGYVVDLVGKRFSHLVVTCRLDEKNKQGSVLWDCLCDCGASCKMSTSRLNSRTATHCGCEVRSKTKSKYSMTHERLLELVFYDKNTGELIRVKGMGVSLAGNRIGWVGKHGHIYADVDSQRYAVHRLIWFYVHRAWPQFDIDHIDGNPANNRIENLRDVDKCWNLQNLKGPKKHNSSGYLGVSAKRGGWAAYIGANGKSKYLGTYKSPEEAAQVYLAAKRKLHPGNTL